MCKLLFHCDAFFKEHYHTSLYLWSLGEKMRKKCLWVGVLQWSVQSTETSWEKPTFKFLFLISLSPLTFATLYYWPRMRRGKVIPPFYGNSKYYHEALSIHVEVIKHSLTFSTSHFYPMEELTDMHMKRLGSLS